METTTTIETSQANAETTISASKKMLWTGRIVSAVSVLVLLMSAVSCGV